MKFDMQKVGTKIFMDLFSEIDLGTYKQRYVDSLCYNSLETPCREKNKQRGVLYASSYGPNMYPMLAVQSNASYS